MYRRPIRAIHFGKYLALTDEEFVALPVREVEHAARQLVKWKHSYTSGRNWKTKLQQAAELERRIKLWVHHNQRYKEIILQYIDLI